MADHDKQFNYLINFEFPVENVHVVDACLDSFQALRRRTRKYLSEDETNQDVEERLAADIYKFWQSFNQAMNPPPTVPKPYPGIIINPPNGYYNYGSGTGYGTGT